jgi:transposase
MATVYRRCCGVDVHKDAITVTVLPPRDRPHLEIKQRVFRTFARDLRQMRTWLGNCRVTDVAMESTGQYWRAVWNVLEGHVPHLLLLNPLHVKALQGEKTDPIDSRRIATLLEMHSLRGSFVPNQEIRELRESRQEPSRTGLSMRQHQAVLSGERYLRSIGAADVTGID